MSKVNDYITDQFGKAAADKYNLFIEAEPSQYIRVNSLKTTPERVAAILNNDLNINTTPVPGITDALKIIPAAGPAGNNNSNTSGTDSSQRGLSSASASTVSKSMEHIAGLFYIQGLSSMLPPLVLNPAPEDKVLDLCAAPGSKTTGLGAMMLNRGTLIANEVQLDRVKMLVHNIERMNLINTAVMHSKGELISKAYSNHFSKVLVDAPCSGLGIIQKKGEVNLWWNIEKARTLGDLQTRLLVSAIKAAAPGGEIVYSTCTLTPEENELVLNTILKNYPVQLMDVSLPVPSHEAFTSYNGTALHPSISKARRILPWEVDSDGFFIARLLKTAETADAAPSNYRGRDVNFLSYRKKDIYNLLGNLKDEFGFTDDLLSRYKYQLKGSDISFTNLDWDDPNPGNLQRIGSKFGTTDKRGNAVLYTEAAQILQEHITNNIYTIEDQDELKRYMEGGTIKKHTQLKGQCAVRYKDYILGTAIVTEAGVKSRFPRSKRTQTINY